MADINGTISDETLIGTADADTMRGLAGADTLLGAGGDDILNGGPGDDVLDGGAGLDLADYSEAAAGAVVNLGLGSAQDGDGGSDTLVAIEGAIGSAFDDVYTATGGALNVFAGLAGDDVVNGDGATRLEYDRGATARIIADLADGVVAGDASVGADTVSGVAAIIATAFDDVLFGSDDDPGGDPNAFESFEGLAGDDVIDGRGGLDHASYTRSSAGVVVSLADGEATEDGFGGNDVLFGIEGVDGSAFDDILEGDANANALSGNAGNDILTGLAGDDVLSGGLGDDAFDGGAGADTMDGGAGIDSVTYANDGAAIDANLLAGFVIDGNGEVDSLTAIENLTATAFDDTLVGNGDANQFNGGAGADTLDGGAGNDVLNGAAGDDVLIGGLGDDVLNGGAGFDVADYSSSATAIAVDLPNHMVDDGAGGADTLGGDIERIVGSNFGDVFILDAVTEIDGGGGFDTIDLSNFAGVANLNFADGLVFDGDTLFGVLVGIENATGGAGADILVGDANANLLAGGAGDDTISGLLGADTLQGGAGNDVLDGGAGDDLIDGGAGDDEIVHNDGDGSDTIVGGANQDTLRINGANLSGDVFLLSAVGAGARFERFNQTSFLLDVIETETIEVNGQAGDDSLGVGDLAATAVRVLIFNGGDGADTLAGAAATGALVADGGAGDDNLTGGAGRDRLVGGLGADVIEGGANDDKIFGNGGADHLSGGAGADQISGASGDDVIAGGAGDDLLAGGAGEDTVDYSDAAGGVVVNLSTNIANDGEGGTDTFVLDGGVSFEVVIGSAFDDVFVPGAFAATFFGGAGSDAIDLSGFAGAATVNLETGELLQGGAAAGTLSEIEDAIGTGFADALTGNADQNTLNGAAGDDTLIGAGGDDILNGGGGNDTIVWNDGDGSDQMSGGSGRDLVQINASVLDGDQFQIDANGAGALFQRVNLTTFQLGIATVEAIEINGDGGEDSLEVGDLTGSSLAAVTFNGGDGDDVLAGAAATGGLIADGGDGDDNLTGGGRPRPVDRQPGRRPHRWRRW